MRWNAVKSLVTQLIAGAKSALEKDCADDLTRDEKFALAYFAGIPMKHDLGGNRFTMSTAVPCGFYKLGEKWIVVRSPPKQI